MKKLAGKILVSRFGWLYLLAFLILVNFLASLAHTRIDLTKENRYTLSPATRDLLRQMDDQLVIEVFLRGELNSGFRKLANSTEDFLGLLKDENGSKVQYRFISPQESMPGTERTYEDSLINLGVSPINLTVQVEAGQESKRVYPVAIVRYKGQESLVNLYSGGKRVITPNDLNNAEALMEYEFARTLDALINPSKPLIAYSSGNGEIMDARSYDLQQTLSRDYQLFLLDINRQPFIPDTFRALIIVKPSLQFSEEEKLKLDQYVMRGGKLLLFVDGLIAEQDSLRFKPETIAYDRNLNLTDMLFRYGVRINPSLLMDLQCDFMPFMVGGSQENPQYEFLHWNYYPLFEPKGNHTITRNLGLVAGRFVNSIDTIQTPGISKTILLSSSQNSRVISTPALISLNENRNAPEDENFRLRDIPVAVLLEGKFTSVFRNRLSGSQADSLQTMGVPFLPSSLQENKMIIVADGDMVMNDVSTSQGPLPMGLNLYTAGSQYEYQFANRDFLLNCLEYLVSNPALSQTRNKSIVLRLLDSTKVQEQRSTWQFINIVAPILLVIVAGLIHQEVRKRKYT